MNVRLGLPAAIILIAVSAKAGTIGKVAGRVVNAKEDPVAGARVAAFWFADQSAPLEPERPAMSGADGRFSLEAELDNRDIVVMAIDGSGALGGFGTISATGPREPVQIEMKPLVEVRIRYASEQSDRSLGETYITISVGDGKVPVAAGRSRATKFTMKLPPGHYSIRGEENRHVEDVREFTLEPGMDMELGEITLQLSKFTQLIGKPAPAWHITDARGVAKNVQPTDFKGKWVVLEFWGYWCGPCIRRGLPGWIDFVDNHHADSDKFVVLAIHDPQATDFAMLDEKLKPIIRRTWHGRSLPFPILLDTSGQMIEDYGVKGWPTAVLLDPEGRVVDVPSKPFVLGSWACEDFLASKLTPLPAAARIASALDRGLSIAVGEGETLVSTLDFYANVARISIRIDSDELKAAGIDQHVRVPLKLGGSLTLRAWLNLTLEPFGLTYVEDGDGLRIVRRSPENLQLAQPSPRQIAENALVSEALKQQVTLDFQDEPLKQVIATLENATSESFAIDPACRMSGAINPDTLVTGSTADEPLSLALTRLFAPLGITFVVRDEAVVLTTRH